MLVAEHGHVRAECAGECTDGCMLCNCYVCATCGALEGALLPFCPGQMLTPQEHTVNYGHYCAGTGPFACTVCGQGHAQNRQHWDAMVEGYHSFDPPRPA